MFFCGTGYHFEGILAVPGLRLLITAQIELQDCLAEVVLEGKPCFFNVLGTVRKFSVPAYLGYPLELWNQKIIAKVDT